MGSGLQLKMPCGRFFSRMVGDGMCPVLVEIGGQPFFSYWVLCGLGMAVCVASSLWAAKRRTLDSFGMSWILAISLMAGMLTARVGHIVLFGQSWAGISDAQHGGQVSFAGIAGGIAVAILMSRVLGMAWQDVCDCTAPGGFVGLGIGRIGCFLYGCCYGSRCDGVIGVRFPKHISVEGDIIGSPAFVDHAALGLIDPAGCLSLPVLPVQLVEATFAVVIGSLGLVLFLRNRCRGRLLWLCLAMYGLSRFGTQWFRPNYELDMRMNGWNLGHTMAVVVTIVGLSALAMRCGCERRLMSAGSHDVTVKGV